MKILLSFFLLGLALSTSSLKNEPLKFKEALQTQLFSPDTLPQILEEV